jgi:hypothetical protein
MAIKLTVHERTSIQENCSWARDLRGNRGGRDRNSSGHATADSPSRGSIEIKDAGANRPALRPATEAESNATWSDAEIIAAREDCVRLLAPTGAEVELSKPVRNGQCGTPAPILLKRVAGLELNPPAVVNCRIAAKVYQWINDSVQPTAVEMLGTGLKRMITASAYTCRQRVGSSTERLSEHSFANALDVTAFVTEDDRSIDVLTGWGPTARDPQAQVTAKSAGGGDARSLHDVEPDTTARFLRRVHEGACGISGQYLGRRQTRRIVTTCTWTWRSGSVARFANKCAPAALREQTHAKRDASVRSSRNCSFGISAASAYCSSLAFCSFIANQRTTCDH